jgi:flavin reductase (DIM6/NTAB) family NADH-FMN oxidoreductase RutF
MNAPMSSGKPPAAIAFREAMSRVAGAVHIVATNGEGGLAGATVTAVTSVTDSPPSLLVCLNQKSRTLAAIRANGAFSVQALAAGQIAVAKLFAGEGGAEGAERFRVADGWTDLSSEGQPLLLGALASFSCRLVQLAPVGTHMIVIGAVEQANAEAGGRALVYHRRGYVEL